MTPMKDWYLLQDKATRSNIMVAPIQIIGAYLGLHSEGMERAVSETDKGRICELYTKYSEIAHLVSYCGKEWQITGERQET